MNYYNENNPEAAAWLRELIARRLIPAGDVDERSIADVKPNDVLGYTQCHFFAEIGGWPEALRLAGWPEDRPVWTGSCPCPPFSSAGKKKQCPACGGKPVPHPLKTGIFACIPCGHEWLADKRHLYPEFYRLIRDCRPTSVLGEQVAGNAIVPEVAAVFIAAFDAAAYAMLCPDGRNALTRVPDGLPGGMARPHDPPQGIYLDRHPVRGSRRTPMFFREK